MTSQATFFSPSPRTPLPKQPGDPCQIIRQSTFPVLRTFPRLAISVLSQSLGPRGLCPCPPLLCSLHSPPLLHCLLRSLKCHPTLNSGPLHWLFPLPGTLFVQQANPSFPQMAQRSPPREATLPILFMTRQCLTTLCFLTWWVHNSLITFTAPHHAYRTPASQGRGCWYVTNVSHRPRSTSQEAGAAKSTSALCTE